MSLNVYCKTVGNKPPGQKRTARNRGSIEIKMFVTKWLRGVMRRNTHSCLLHINLTVLVKFTSGVNLFPLR